MTTGEFRPDRRYEWKLITMVGLSGALAVLFSVVLAVVIGLDVQGTEGAYVGAALALLANALWLLPTLVLLPVYARSIRYEMREDSVVAYMGILTRSVKLVPFRTVTNIKVTCGPFDRLFGVGTLHVETAGISGQTGAEQTLVGLSDVNGVYEQVATALRRYRGAMSPTQAEQELSIPDGDVLRSLLTDVRAIRRAVERR